MYGAHLEKGLGCAPSPRVGYCLSGTADGVGSAAIRCARASAEAVGRHPCNALPWGRIMWWDAASQDDLEVREWSLQRGLPMKFSIQHQRALVGNGLVVGIEAEAEERISRVTITLDGFDLSDDAIDPPSVSCERQFLRFDRQSIGMPLSSHPAHLYQT